MIVQSKVKIGLYFNLCEVLSLQSCIKIIRYYWQIPEPFLASFYVMSLSLAD